MDPTSDTGDHLHAADPQTGEGATHRDPGGDRGRDLDITAREPQGEGQSEEMQTHNKGTTSSGHSGKLKTGKRIQAASGGLATCLERDKRFQRELEHLHKRLKFATPRLQAPVRKPHQPYVFNSLRPYCNLSTIHFLALDLPQDRSHRSRRTVFGLIEPWVDLQMDNDLQSDIDPHLVSHDRNKHTQRTASTTRHAASGAHGVQTTVTARLAKFPAMVPPTPTQPGQQMGSRDVSTLRPELGALTRPGARSKFLADYRQTHAHFYRSQLHRLDLFHPASRPHVCSSYLAYLQNTPGSRRAITDCMHRLALSSG